MAHAAAALDATSADAIAHVAASLDATSAADAAGATVLVAMSGGVDSSVTAAALHAAGLRVVGVTMKTFCYSEVEGPSRSCCGLEGIADARSVAARLGIVHYVEDVEEDFTRDVIRDFVSEYAAGRTPIPCVRCNSFTKFRDLARRADALGCEYLATGHYARVVREDGVATLRRAEDDRKDQTYFLWGIPRAVLDRLILPVGDLRKPAVRAAARDLGLPVAEKPESFEICFVPDNDYVGVLRRYLGEDHPALSAGPFLLEDGTRAGAHDGYAGFTVGQRKGLPGGFGEPMYVLEIRPEDRAVVIGPRGALDMTRVRAVRANWLARPPRPGERLGVRIRHGAAIVEGRVVEVRGGTRAGDRAAAPTAAVDGGADGVERGGARADGGAAPGDGGRAAGHVEPVHPDDRDAGFTLELGVPQRAITPGQSAVLYRDDVVVGGGVIV